jgi:flagellar biosynthetic protein FliQ
VHPVHAVVLALREALLLMVPTVGALVLTAVVTGALQAATQMQDAALGFAPKLAVIAAVLAASGAWLFEHLVSFTRALWGA